MRVALVGGTGFLGKRVAVSLSRQESLQGRLVAVVRQAERAGRLRELGFELAEGDLSDEASIRAAIQPCDAVVATTGLKLGHTPALMRALAGTGVGRGVFVSTASILQNLEQEIRATVLRAEDLIRNSGISYTILRPTMIYGTADDVNIHKLIQFAARFGFFPVLGSGRHLQQPVHVLDVADAVVSALITPAASDRSYCLSGKTPLPFDDMLDTVGRALGRNVRRLKIPLPVALAAAHSFALLPRRPFSAGQVRRNNEDKSLGHEEAARDIGFDPMDFETGVARQVAEMQAAGLI